MDKPTFVYVSYINATAERVWEALTDGEITRQYWCGQQNVSDWKAGSPWRHEDAADPATVDGVGTVVESDRPRRLVVTWAAPDKSDDPTKHPRVTYDIIEDGGMVRLTVTEHQLDPTSDSADGWAMVFSGLKTLLETGTPMPPIVTRDATGGFTHVRFG